MLFRSAQKILYAIAYIVMIGLFSGFFICMIKLCIIYGTDLCSYHIFKRIVRCGVVFIAGLAGLICIGFVWFILLTIYRIFTNNIIHKITDDGNGHTKRELVYINIYELDPSTVTAIKSKRWLKRFRK